MKLSQTVKPISHVKSHLSGIVEGLSKNHRNIIITHNGEARAVLQDIERYEQMQESLTMLKLVSMSARSMAEGKGQPVKAAFSEIKKQMSRQRY